MRFHRRAGLVVLAAMLSWFGCARWTMRSDGKPACLAVRSWCRPPPEFSNDFGHFRSPLLRSDGPQVRVSAEWPKRRAEIVAYWNNVMGPWPELLPHPKMRVLAEERRENFSQKQIELEIAAGLKGKGYLLTPDGKGPFPAVLVVYYEPESSIGRGSQTLRDFGYQLARRGFVTLSIGSPGGDARRPDTASARCQPLSFLGYVAANCHTALTRVPGVDPLRIGVVGHSYGGKWAMFASCLYEKFACAAWSDPGIVFDESKSNVNYWEPWYLGADPAMQRRPGLIAADNPRTGAYRKLVEEGHDLHELHALMAPRPFLVSGGSEDREEAWKALNHAVAVNKLLGHQDRVALTTRAGHNPTEQSNEQIYQFFECWLK